MYLLFWKQPIHIYIHIYNNNTRSNLFIPMAIADSDPRMSQIVIHGGIVYLSGQVDQEATDAMGQTEGKSSQSRHCMK